MELRKAYQAMIRAFAGGWDSMAAALGYNRCKLENLVYERGGAGAQYMSVNDALQMQAFSNTQHFAEAIAQVSGGVFIALPAIGHVDNEDISEKFAELVERLGQLSAAYREYTVDNVVTRREWSSLQDIAYQIQITLMQYLTLVSRVYCEAEKVDARTVQVTGVGAKTTCVE